MVLLKQTAIIFFNLIDKFIHQKKILKYLKKENIHINTWLDVGSHRGLYTDLIVDNFKIKKGYLFEPQKKFLDLLEKNIRITKTFIPIIVRFQI